LSRYIDQNFVAWQLAYLAAQNGVLDDDLLNSGGWSYVFHDFLPGRPEYWEQTKYAFDERFVQWMEKNVVNL
jgi:hypothetical protein